MRGLPVRRIASTALCATLVLGIAAPIALAAEGDTAARERTLAASRAPVPGADTVTSQLELLSALGIVLTPVTELLDTAMKADNGQLTADQAKQFGDAVKQAVATITTVIPATPATPPATTTPDTAATTDTAAATDTAATTTDTAATTGTDTAATTATDTAATTATGTAPTTTTPAGATGTAPTTTVITDPATTSTLPLLTRSAAEAKARTAAADLRKDALTALQQALDTLLAAVTSGDVGQVLPATTAVVNDLVDLVAATLLGGDLPAPTLAGLPQPAAAPATSSTPATPALPATPAAPAPPALSAITPPARTGALLPAP
ncbi:hypothetical protein [Streptomyces sp. NPDC059894]|uniref:hypothetical protein n=1 Tax=unclassified Streptomyces TaxID=2593676 RepID=UPI0036664EC8